MSSSAAAIRALPRSILSRTPADSGACANAGSSGRIVPPANRRSRLAGAVAATQCRTAGSVIRQSRVPGTKIIA
jgi:hypothetical protein